MNSLWKERRIFLKQLERADMRVKSWDPVKRPKLFQKHQKSLMANSQGQLISHERNTRSNLGKENADFREKWLRRDARFNICPRCFRQSIWQRPRRPVRKILEPDSWGRRNVELWWCREPGGDPRPAQPQALWRGTLHWLCPSSWWPGRAQTPGHSPAQNHWLWSSPQTQMLPRGPRTQSWHHLSSPLFRKMRMTPPWNSLLQWSLLAQHILHYQQKCLHQVPDSTFCLHSLRQSFAKVPVGRSRMSARHLHLCTNFFSLLAFSSEIIRWFKLECWQNYS